MDPTRLCLSAMVLLVLGGQELANAQTPNNTVLSSDLKHFFSEVGIRIIKPADALQTTNSRSQKCYEMLVSVSEQRRRAFQLPHLVWKEPRKSLTATTLMADDFDRHFPNKNWQLLTTPESTSWRQTTREAISGSYSVGCFAGDQKIKDSTNASSLSWLISGPYDLSQTDYAALDFYASVQTPLNSDVFFWGVSVNGSDYCGIGTLGNSQGWQFVHFSLKEVPIWGDMTGSPQVWLALFFGSRTSEIDSGVYVDQVRFVQGADWQKETSAIIEGTINPNAYSGGIGLARPAFVDIDADGDFDLFVGEYDGNVNFYRNDGTTANPVWTLADCNYAAIDVGENSAPSFVDFDKDGDPDLFVGDSEGTISFFQNNGSRKNAVWSFVGKLKDAESKLIDVGTTSTPAFVDLDKDGDLDLIIGNTEGHILFYRNESRGNKMFGGFSTKPYLGMDVGDLSAPTFADIDGDGNEDLFIGTRDRTMVFYKNTSTSGQPDFSLGSTNFDSIKVGRVTAPAFADIDGDGDLDLCIGQADGEVTFFVNKGNKTQWKFKPSSGALGHQPFDVGFRSAPALVDIDDDGDLDLIVGSGFTGEIYFYENRGNAESPKWHLVGKHFGEMSVKAWNTPAFVDINADGDLDLFSGPKAGKISFFRNEGDKSRPKWILVSDYYDSLLVEGQSYLTFADIDHDGDFDLFIGADTHGISFYENVGTSRKPKWKLVTNDFINLDYIYHSTPVFVDMDRDGDLDFFAGSHDGTIIFCQNVGDPKHPDFKLITTKYNNIDVRYFSVPAFGDIDNDGDLDLFLGNNSGGLNFWRNLSNDPTYIDKQADLIKKSSRKVKL